MFLSFRVRLFIVVTLKWCCFICNVQRFLHPCLKTLNSANICSDLALTTDFVLTYWLQNIRFWSLEQRWKWWYTPILKISNDDFIRYISKSIDSQSVAFPSIVCVEPRWQAGLLVLNVNIWKMKRMQLGILVQTSK